MRRHRSAPRRRSSLGPGLLLLASLCVAACSFNTATGRVQLTRISDAEEVELGAEHDAKVVEQLGLYEDERLVELVRAVGAKLAAESERPGLPWTFRVLDDPTVNAFALPGGFIYVTRGLLVHLRSEHELAAVLGHEIGHVTARHGVVQLRKSRVAAASVGIFRVIDPNLRHVGGIAASTAGLALLRHSRDDEFEADSLALRYTQRAGFSPAATVGVLELLARVSQAASSERIPSWLSTHPDPERRRARVNAMTAGAAPGPEPAFLATLDGVVYGRDPREGFIVESTFVHPDAGFRIDLPADWKAAHEGQRVMAASKDERALLVLSPTPAESAASALEEFFADGAFERGEGWAGDVGGFAVASSTLAVSIEGEASMGLLAFIDYDDGQVIAMLALGPAEDWDALRDTIARCFASFARAPAPLRAIEPMRVRLRELTAPASLAQVHERWPSVIELSDLALLNGVEPQQPLPAGTWVKRVEGLTPRP